MAIGTASHPAVLRALEKDPPNTRPTWIETGSVPIISYSSRRLTFKKTALMQLPPDGILLIRVRPSSGENYAVAMTRTEFEREFSNILASDSWLKRGIYDCNAFPLRARPFLAGTGTPKAGPKTTPGPVRHDELEDSWGSL